MSDSGVTVGFTDAVAHLVLVQTRGAASTEIVVLINHETRTLEARCLTGDESPPAARQFFDVLDWARRTSVSGQATDRAWLAAKLDIISDLTGCTPARVCEAPFPSFPDESNADAWDKLYAAVDWVEYFGTGDTGLELS
jgi:hypothetical protein